MSLTVEVKKLSQDIAIEDGNTVIQNYAILMLPNGGFVKAAIDSEAAEALLDALIHGGESEKILRQEVGYEPPRRNASPPPSMSGFRETTLPDGSKGMEFGGDGDDRPTLEDPPPPPPQPTVRPGKMKVVGKTDMGYPIVKGEGNIADPGEISAGLGSPGADEDGVASL